VIYSSSDDQPTTINKTIKGQLSRCRYLCTSNYPVPDTSGDGVLFSIDFFVALFVCYFISFFVSLLARLRENGWTDLHEIFREGVKWPWDDVIQFLVNSEKPRDAVMLISLSATLRANRWTDLHEIFREGVEWPWDDLVTFLVNSEKPRDAAMRNTGTGFVVLSHHSLLMIGERWDASLPIRIFSSRFLLLLQITEPMNFLHRRKLS